MHQYNREYKFNFLKRQKGIFFFRDKQSFYIYTHTHYVLKFTNNKIYQQQTQANVHIVLRWFSIKFKLNNSIFFREFKVEHPRFNLSQKTVTPLLSDDRRSVKG